MKKPSQRIVTLVGHQRAGTHMLGTCIGSHPDVEYLDELTTHWRRTWLTAHIETPRDLEDAVDRKFADRGGRWLLLDVKFNQIKICPPVEDFVRARKCIGIVRNDNANWFYSFLHARYRKFFKLAEYGDTPKAQAKPTEPPPFISFPPWLMTQETATKWAYYARFLYLADVIFSYEDLTKDRDIKRLPDWAAKRICWYLQIEERPLTTTMTKMSQVDVHQRYKFGALNTDMLGEQAAVIKGDKNDHQEESFPDRNR